MFQLHPYQQELVNEARSKLADGNKSVCIVSPAGSGKSVIIAEIARRTVQKGGQVLFIVHRKELVDQITASFKQQDVDLHHCTIMTVIKVRNRLGKIPKPNLIITDESHHSLAKTYKQIYDYYADVVRLGFTATPWRMNGNGLGEIYDEMVTGKSVKWLIEHHYLAPFKYYSVSNVDRNKLKRSSTGDYTSSSINNAMSKTVFGDVVEKYQKLANDQQAVLYAHSVEYSNLYAEEFQKHGINAIHVDAQTPTKQRNQIMSEFKAGKIKVLCNVDLISEGFNIPEVPVVMLLRPTKSLVIYIQQAMRGMRYRPGKVAIIIDQVANAYEFGALPDNDWEWSLEGRAKSAKARTVSECEFCHATFYSDEWITSTNEETHRMIKICPECGREKPVLPQDRDGSKRVQDAKLVDLATKQGRLNLLANKRPRRQRSLWTIYQVLDAQKQTGAANVKYPMQRALHIRLDQEPTIAETELVSFADHLQMPVSRVMFSYHNALKKHQQPTTKLFNF